MEGLLDVGYVSIGSLVDKLTELYKNNIQQPPVMLWGPPGIGKSDGVRQVANNLHNETGRPVYVFDIRLLLLNPVDLNGLPVPDENKEYAKWLQKSHAKAHSFRRGMKRVAVHAC